MIQHVHIKEEKTHTLTHCGQHTQVSLHYKSIHRHKAHALLPAPVSHVSLHTFNVHCGTLLAPWPGSHRHSSQSNHGVTEIVTLISFNGKKRKLLSQN